MEKQIVPIENKISKHSKEELIKIQKLLDILNKEPKMVQVHPLNQDVLYQPISHIQMLLDQNFFGLWQTKNFHTQVIVNEIVGQIELSVKHPLTGEWITRIGSAAVPIRQKKGSPIGQVDTKYKDALVMDMPHLMTQCIKSAAASLGKVFGRDMNRELQDSYSPVIPSEEKEDWKKEIDAINNLVDLKKYLIDSDRSGLEFDMYILKAKDRIGGSNENS